MTPRARRPLARKLRFGVMASGTSFPAWQARCIRELVASGHAEPALLIVNRTPKPAGTRWEKLRRRIARRDLLWAAFLRLFVVVSARASRREGLADVFDGVPEMGCVVTLKGKFSEHFDPADVEAIRAAKLDFILRFEFGIIRGEILEAAKFGVWSFHHDDEAVYRGGPPCFWEIYRKDPVTGAVLQRLTDRLDGGVILHKGWFRTVDHSYARNRDQAYFGGASWPARVCADIRGGLGGYVEGEPTPSTAPIFKNPRARQVLRFTLRVFANFWRNQWRGIMRADIWAVGVVGAPIERFLEDGHPPKVERWLATSERGRYWADPFAVIHHDRVSALVEDFDYATRQGRITALSVDVAVPLAADVVPVTVHASYPFVFENAGEILCVPETYQAREVALFRATDVPLDWERVGAILTDVAALDATVFRHQDRWWLLATDRDRGPNDTLFAWHAGRLAGPWIPHAQNPIKTDVRSARPGGTPFVHDGVLYRPAQDNAGTYGGAVVINRVDVLTPTEFREEVVKVIRPYPGRYAKGMHTLSAAGELTLVDGKRTRFVWPAFRAELAARFRGRGR